MSRARTFGLALLCALGALLAAPPVLAQDLVPLPAQPEDTPWPTTGWPTGPLPANTEPFALQGLVEAAFKPSKSGPMGETRAVVIVYRGRVVLERYRPGYDRDTKLVSWSMAKSITQTLVGRAVAEGRVADLDAPMPLPEEFALRRDPNWRDWMQMTDGIVYNEVGETNIYRNDVIQMMYGPGRYDVLAYGAGLEQKYPPGRVWNYSTLDYHLIGNALETVLGLPGCTLADAARDADACPIPREAAFAGWTRQTLFDPLGMKVEIEFDHAGTYLGGSLVWASARDFAKFGLLYLRDGVWEGRRILPPGWVDFARTPGPDRSVNIYGAGFWIHPPAGTPMQPEGFGSPYGPRDAFSAQGHEGQIIWIVPSKDLIIVRLGLMTNDRDNWQTLYDWCQSLALLFPDVP